MTAKRLRIAGRVQGVGYRDWMAQTASGLGVSGWVRNRTDGTVEELLRACRRGPRFARVDTIEEALAQPEDEPGFRRLPTG